MNMKVVQIKYILMIVLRIEIYSDDSDMILLVMKKL